MLTRQPIVRPLVLVAKAILVQSVDLIRVSMQDVQCKASPDGGLLDQIGADEIAVAVKQQLRIELAPQLIQMSQPFTALGQQQAELRVSLPDGSKPTLQVNLTQTGSNP